MHVRNKMQRGSARNKGGAGIKKKGRLSHKREDRRAIGPKRINLPTNHSLHITKLWFIHYTLIGLSNYRFP